MLEQIIGDDWSWFSAGQRGAPQMNGAPGSEGQILQVLDAVLDENGGFNVQTVSSVVIDVNKVTLKFGTNTGYLKSQFISITGADDVLLNGKHKIRNVIGNDIILNIEGISQTTGIIKTKVAPLGWESIFGKTNALKRAYRSKDVDSTKTVIYLDCALPSGHGYHATNPAKRAAISLCENMTELGVQLNSYTDKKNDYANNPNGSLFWYQARSRSKTNAVTFTKNIPWVCFGNSKFLIFFTVWSDYATNMADSGRDFYFFGDYNKFSENDNYNCILGCSYSPNDTISNYRVTNGSSIGKSTIETSYCYFSIKDIGGYDFKYNWLYAGGSDTIIPSGENTAFSFPNPVTLSTLNLPVYVCEDSTMKGLFPRLKFLPQDLGTGNGAMDLVQQEGCIFVRTQYRATSTGKSGYFGIDMRD